MDPGPVVDDDDAVGDTANEHADLFKAEIVFILVSPLSFSVL